MEKRLGIVGRVNRERVPGDIYRSRAVITRGPMLIACTTIDIYVNERL